MIIGENFLIAMNKFKIGDRVRLISGSDVMTVCEVFGYRLVDCNWVGKENKTYKNSFRPDSLVLCERINDFNFAKIAEKVLQLN